ncbi:Rha family transcriptional regulator [Escherichia coli]
MEICILEKPSMTSIEIAELVGSRPDNVKRTIERLSKSGVIPLPPMEVSENINNLGFKVKNSHYVFEGEQGKRDSIIVVAQLSPEFTARLAAKCGLTEAKCRNLVNAFRIPTDTHEFLTPEGVLSRRSIVALSPFMNAFNRMMSEAEHRGKRWYHPKMGQFQVIGWGGE